MRLLLIITAVLLTTKSIAQDVYADYRASWLEKAEAHTPELYFSKIVPKSIVSFFEDDSFYQSTGVKVEDNWQSGEKYYKQGDKVILDFGQHVVGKLSLSLKANIALHAPVRLKLKFGEMPREMLENFDDYSSTLSSAWLQEEYITIHEVPTTIELPHRYSFKYLQFEVLGSASNISVSIEDIFALHQTSANTKGLITDTTTLMQKIEKVSLKTLEDCMQTVFEDGPKRDRRLWVGDLKLQALANYYSFENSVLIKRCLYLLAATASENGLVYGTVFERPQPHPEKHFPIDYSLLYNTILFDYFEYSKDRETIEDLWVIAEKQLSLISKDISEKGAFQPKDGYWYFIDWNESLDKEVALHGCILYSLIKTKLLAKSLGKKVQSADLDLLINRMSNYAKSNFVGTDGTVISQSGQVSMASWAWMVLADVLSTKEAKKGFLSMQENNKLVKPVSPYLYHYVVEALIDSKLHNAAKSIMTNYWGGMVNQGADTFWEVYDVDDDFLSPYNSSIMNSSCHAWSCTPIYFIRKYPEVFRE